MTADELTAQGHTHQENGDHADAVTAYLRAFELAPTDWRLPSEAGRLCLYVLGDAARAVPAYEAALPLIEDAILARDTRYHLGVARTLLEDDVRAAPLFEAVLAHTPTHVLACIELGKVLTRKGDHTRAKDLLQQAVVHNNMRSTLPEMFPDGQRGTVHAEALAWLNLGRLAIAMGDEEEATAAAVHLLDDVTDWDRVVKLAEEAHAVNESASAVAILGELLARRPSDPDEETLHERAASLWCTITIDEGGLADWVVQQAAASIEADPDWANRLVEEVLRRHPDHAEALRVQAKLA